MERFKMSNPVEKYLNESGQTTLLITNAQKELIKTLIDEKIEECEENADHLIRQRRIKEEKGQLERVRQYSNYLDKEIQLRIDLIELKKRILK
jgi:hypothetical protein